ncbi:MAG TPA: HipA domain-containing protein [Microvirga sp.]|nr:HipA domain-containing protein [Microvirga sp.]
MAERSATVLFKDAPAGTLTELEGGGTRFTYREGWTTPIACTLPTNDREHVWRAGLHPFFQHLGPEGWLREKQARAGRVDEEDDFGLLLRYGRDCIGAVGVQASEDLQAPITSIGDVEAEAATSSRRTVSGVQRKLLAYKDDGLYHPSSSASPATHIAKFNDRTNDTLVRNELTTLRLAQELLGEREVTRFEAATITELEEIALVVERFDRTPTGEKLRLEDFAQILNKPRGLDFKGKYDASYEEVAAALKTYSARPIIDLDRLYRRIVVNFLVGNADAHLKNFSLLEYSEGMRLSPAYDILNTLWYGAQYDTHVALSINGERPLLDEINHAMVLEFGRSIGLNDRAITKALRDLKGRLSKSRIINRPPNAPPSEFFDRYNEIVTNAGLRILET